MEDPGYQSNAPHRLEACATMGRDAAMEILVINLMRLGDLIQCSPVLRGLRARYPRARITLMAEDLFQAPAALVPEVDRLLLLPTVNLATAVCDQESWLPAYRMLEDWLATHLKPRPDLVVNLTPTLLGAVLAFLAGAPQVQGLTLHSARQFSTSPSWMSYFFIISRSRRANPFNLVDCFRRIAGLPPDATGLAVRLPAEDRARADAGFTSQGLPPGTLKVGLVPGASQDARRWPTENFAQAAQLLQAGCDCHFFIFGSRAELPLGEALQRLLPPGSATLCMGGTSIPQLAAMLSRLDLLITNDTGPMHVAAAVGTPVLALFLAGARVMDTGPVGEGHLALEPRLDCHPCQYPSACKMFRCHQALSPGAVAHWALQMLEQKPLAPVPDTTPWLQLQAYRSGWDPLGYHTVLPLVRRPLDRRHFWTLVHRAAWVRLLDGMAEIPASWRAWQRQVLKEHFLPPSDDLETAGGRAAFGQVLDLAGQGEHLACRSLQLTHNPARIRQQSEAIRGIDPQLARLAVSFPELAALVEFYFQEQRLVQETELLPLVRRAMAAYRQLGQGGKIFLEEMEVLQAQIPGMARLSGPCGSVAQNLQTTETRDYIHQEVEVVPCM